MKKIINIFLLIILILSGCSNIEKGNNDNDLSIISLAPNITESLIAMNKTNQIIAVDTFSKFDELNQDVEKIDAWNLPVEQLISLNPDIILFSDYSKNETIEKSLENSGIKVVYISGANSIEDIYNGILEIGNAIEDQDASKKLVDSMKNEIEILNEKYKTDNPKSVYFEISPSPDLYTVGKNTYINEMIEIAGGKNIFNDQNGFFQPSAEAIASSNPSIIITSVSEDSSTSEIKSRNGFDKISAVSNNKVFQIDANLTDRPGPSIIEGIKEIASILNE